MATIPLINVKLSDYGENNGIRVVKWEGLGQGDDGAPSTLINFADRTIQVFGTFGAGGSVRVEGSLDGVNYAPLTDPQGNYIVLSTAKLEAISEVVRYIRPVVVGGDGTTDLTVSIVFRKG